MWQLEDCGIHLDSTLPTFYDNGHKEFIEFGNAVRILRTNKKVYEWSFPKFTFAYLIFVYFLTFVKVK